MGKRHCQVDTYLADIHQEPYLSSHTVIQLPEPTFRGAKETEPKFELQIRNGRQNLDL